MIYADDTMIYYAAKGVAEITKILNANVKIIGDWATKTEIFLHQGKQEAVVYGTHKRRSISDPLPLQIYGFDIKLSDVHKYLGV